MIQRLFLFVNREFCFFTVLPKRSMEKTGKNFSKKYLPGI